MPTRPLPSSYAQGLRRATRPPSGRLSGARAPQPAVPPFGVLFPTPDGYGLAHPLQPLYRAANQVYRERLAVYRQKAAELAPPQLVRFIREDVVSNLLAVAKLEWGPFAVPYYRFLDPKQHFAWWPSHHARLVGLVAQFGKQYRLSRRVCRVY